MLRILANIVYKLLCSQKFVDFYEKIFLEHIQDRENGPPQTVVIEELMKLLNTISETKKIKEPDGASALENAPPQALDAGGW